MRFPWERDLIRTCAKCGESWTVPYLLRRQKPQARPRGGLLRMITAKAQTQTRLDPWSRQAAEVRAAAAQRARVDDERELIAGLARCSACLSTDYVDTPKKPRSSAR